LRNKRRPQSRGRKFRWGGQRIGRDLVKLPRTAIGLVGVLRATVQVFGAGRVDAAAALTIIAETLGKGCRDHQMTKQVGMGLLGTLGGEGSWLEFHDGLGKRDLYVEGLCAW